MAQHTQDEGFHEIQLNGKQLVFLFMAATVVSVVIFLCGVLVGRGVRSQVATIDTSAPSTVTEIAPAPSPASAPAPAAGSDPTKAAPPAGDDLSYFKRLETQNPPAEQLKPASDRKPAPEKSARAETAVEPPTPAPKPAPAPVREKTPPPAAEKAPAPEKARAAAPVPAPEPAAPAASAPPGQGFAVQIAALNVRSEADAIAKRLNSKGYAAYVLTPANGTPSVFRVRVGTFTTRREAESIAAKLQKEEQFKPWVTR